MKFINKRNAIGAFLYMAMSSTVFAASGNVEGTVNTIRYHSNEISTDSWKMASWIKLNGVATAGSCLTRSGNDFDGAGGLVAFKVEADDSVAMSILLMAKAQGKKVALHWDDSIKDSGYCKAMYLTLSN